MHLPTTLHYPICLIVQKLSCWQTNTHIHKRSAFVENIHLALLRYARGEKCVVVSICKPTLLIHSYPNPSFDVLTSWSIHVYHLSWITSLPIAQAVFQIMDTWKLSNATESPTRANDYHRGVGNYGIKPSTTSSALANFAELSCRRCGMRD